MNTAVSPFEVQLAPLQCYFEVSFTGHDHYCSLELQRLHVKPEKSGYVVMLHRKDGAVDVLPEPHLGTDRDWWERDPSVANYKLGSVEPTELGNIRLVTSSEGVDVSVSLTDSAGRRISAVVKSASSGPAKPRSLFLPQSPFPKARLLWFLYLFRFAPLRQSDSIEIVIDGQRLEPKLWPWPIAIRRHIFSRYTIDMAFFTLNPIRPQPIPPIDQDVAFQSGTAVQEDSGAIRCWNAQQAGHQIQLEFSPPIPTLPVNETAQAGAGTFGVRIDGIGVTNGEYRVSCPNAETTVVEFSNVDQKWYPPGMDLSVWIFRFYHRLKIMRARRWYWKGVFERRDGEVECNSGWELNKT